jgi:hypothetical protein
MLKIAEDVSNVDALDVMSQVNNVSSGDIINILKTPSRTA